MRVPSVGWALRAHAVTRNFRVTAQAISVAITLATTAHAAQVGVHDPVMAREGSTYYLYSTGPGITFYSSPDMLHWKPEGRVFAGEPTWAKRAAPTFNDHIWAPDIHRHNGRW